ncbi:MAG TPA: STAS domain-containing protein [Candidatus Binatia bacterium]|jgi:anti-anti-sigma factor
MEPEKAASVSIAEREGKPAIFLRGAVDIFFAADLRHAAIRLLERGEDVLICCEKLERLDTATLQILLALKKELEQKGNNLRMIELPSEPARLIGLAGMSGYLL